MWQRILASCKHASSVLLARPILSYASTIGRSGASLIRSSAVSTSRRQRWTPKEDQMLVDLSAKEIAVMDMADMFPGRTLYAVTRRRERLNLTRFKKQAPYSQAEDETLLRLRSECKPWTTVLSALPQRSRGALERRLARLRRKDMPPEPGTTQSSRCRWTDEEQQKLRDLVSQGLPWREIAHLMPSRSIRGLQAAARAMGLPMTQSFNRWTTAEDEALVKGCEAGMTYKSIHATMLPGRTPVALKHRWTRGLKYQKR